MNPVVEALALLTPFDIDKPKIRLGPPADGGYVFVEDIAPDQAIVSYGISTEYSFDAEMADKGHDVYMFDHTIPGIDATSKRMHFFREGVAGSSDPAASLYTIEDHLARHAIPGDRLILKMDVEGAEFAALSAVPDRVLERFEQIVLEVHGLHRMADFAYRETFCAVFRKLNRHFTLFHVHANNCDGPNGLHIVSGLPVSSLLELSYVRTNTVKPSPSRTLYPTPLDYPNVRKKDKLLWFFPFLPTSVSHASFSACEDLVEQRTPGRGPDQSRVPVHRAGLVDVARGKPALQSSTSRWSVAGEASRAVSGTMPTNFAFHTDVEDRPWWMVDLLDPYPIEAIVVHNRLDGFQDRADTCKVEVSYDRTKWQTIHAGTTRFSGADRGPPLALHIGNGALARYVRVSLEARQCLHLSQVEVLADPTRLRLAEFRRRYKLPNLRFPECKGISHSFSTYQIMNPEAALIGLKITRLGRFGNQIKQMSNAIAVARRLRLQYIQILNDEYFQIKGPEHINGITLLPETDPLPTEGAFLAGHFFNAPDLQPLLEDMDAAERYEIVQTMLKPMLAGNLGRDEKREDELTIHMRAGDIFADEKPHGSYFQPPLCFYTLVIERAISDGTIRRVRLVYEDRGNPCVDALEEFMKKNDIPYRMQSKSLWEDVTALIDSPRLVFGLGTFGPTICQLSNRIEDVFHFQTFVDWGFHSIPSVRRTILIRDKAGGYFKRGEWRNTPDQYKMMLTYPVEALEFAEVKRPPQ